MISSEISSEIPSKIPFQTALDKRQAPTMGCSRNYDQERCTLAPQIFNVQNTLMAGGPLRSWNLDQETMLEKDL